MVMDGEKAMAVLAIIQQLIPEAKKISKAHGFVHKRAEAEINGIRGFLVWDFIVYNEITFDDIEGNIMSFFTSTSDDKTEVEWNRLVRKYGVNTDK